MTSPIDRFRLELRQCDDILIAICIGPFTPETNSYLDRTVAEECKARGLRKILVDLRQLWDPPNDSVVDSYQGAVNLWSRGYTAQMRIAYVDREKYRPDNDMFRLVARNRGINLQHSYTLDSALEWLRD